LVKVLAKWKV
jgi:hypothetical protein